MTQSYMLRDGSTAAYLRVIRMRGENKNIEFQLKCLLLTEGLELEFYWTVSISFATRNFSASSAPMHPVPAAVTACRYTLSAASPTAKTPSTLVFVEPG